MRFRDVIYGDNPEGIIVNILKYIHENGPDDQHMLEILSYVKKFNCDVFDSFEGDIISALGAFYKVREHNSFYSYIMNAINITHQEKFGLQLTPVQANIRQAIEKFKYTSISAPTSAGKSFSIKDFILRSQNDAVIIVPSRALIAEYILTIKEYFSGSKNVMISSFPDIVYRNRALRRVFVLTPERCNDLFKMSDQLDVDLFFFDEAHISEELERGLIFESLVKKVLKKFPDSKIVFAHPFVENPEAQFSKNMIDHSSRFSKSYPQGIVGKIFINIDKNGHASYFSPFEEKGYFKNNLIDFECKVEDFIFSNSLSVLVYVSKSSLYDGKFILGFEDYIDGFNVLSDGEALIIIEKISDIIGANETDHRSKLISLLRRGIVIHHGSVPLEVRFLIEEFIRKGFAKICFATSTLAQGINMPFDVVWLENNRFIGDEEERSLAFKNLIGRAGRLSSSGSFDFGYVVTNNSKLLTKRINHEFFLNSESLINREDVDYKDPIQNELIDSFRNDTFNDELNIPESRADRLRQTHVVECAEKLLDLFYNDSVSTQDYTVDFEQKDKVNAINLFKKIYEASLGRDLLEGEAEIFHNSIHILFHLVKGRKFREIAGIRYSYISDKNNENHGMARFSQPAAKIPDIRSRYLYSIYPKNTYAKDVSYDRIVFDTYDYIDQVLTFSVSEVIVSAFSLFLEERHDQRANRMISLLRFGTNDEKYIMLVRYGFTAEQIEQIYRYVKHVDVDSISFSADISEVDDSVLEAVSWYL